MIVKKSRLFSFLIASVVGLFLGVMGTINADESREALLSQVTAFLLKAAALNSYDREVCNLLKNKVEKKLTGLGKLYEVAEAPEYYNYLIISELILNEMQNRGEVPLFSPEEKLFTEKIQKNQWGKSKTYELFTFPSFTHYYVKLTGEAINLNKISTWRPSTIAEVPQEVLLASFRENILLQEEKKATKAQVKEVFSKKKKYFYHFASLLVGAAMIDGCLPQEHSLSTRIKKTLNKIATYWEKRSKYKKLRNDDHHS